MMDRNISNYSSVDDSENPKNWVDLMIRFPDMCPEVKNVRALLLRWLSPIKQGLVVDAGAGPGVTSFQMAKVLGEDVQVVGADLSQHMVNYATENFHADNLRYQAMSLKEMRFADESVDAVRIERCLHHVSDVSEAFDEIARILKPGGIFVVNEPDTRYACIHPLPPAMNADYAARYDSGIANGSMGFYLTEYLDNAGFEVLDHQPHFLMLKDAKSIDECFHAIDLIRELCRERGDNTMIGRVEKAIQRGSFFFGVPAFSVLAEKR